MSELPARIGRYQIRGELGRGMMGVVYEAHDPVLGREIALKVINLGFGASEEDRRSFERRFLTEARAAASLSHPGILVVHDVGQDPSSGAPFMALELLRGQTLDKVICERAPIDWRESLRIAGGVADALHHAHSQGVIHRDIKPANIMLLATGEPKIMDFGIAKVEASQLTAAGQLFGTPLYMSPEQALAQPIDARSDLFSLGSLLYEMLTGRAAFAAESVTKILFQVVSREPEPANAWVPALPEDVQYVLARCLAKQPADRYADGRALAEDLEHVRAGLPLPGRVGWHAVPAPARTRVSAAPVLEAAAPLESPLEALVTAPPSPVTATAVTAVSQPLGVATTPTVVRPASPQRPGRVAIIAGLAALAVVSLVAVAWLRGRGEPGPVAWRASPAPSGDAAETASVAPSGAVEQSRPDARSARLRVDLEHSIRAGILRIWVDDLQVVEERIGGRVTREIVGIEFRKGRRSDTLEIVPGRHEVKVQVSWDDNVKTESIWANFEPESTRRLKAKLGGLRKKLSLEWL